MDNDPLIAETNLKSSGDKLNKVYSSVVDMQSEMRNYSRDVYYRISLLSGGILSLDITFIGYLANKSVHLNYSELLYASWVLLIFSLIGGLYRNHYNLDMGHYQTTIELNKARLEQWEAKLILLKTNPTRFYNLKSKKDVEEDVVQTTKNISTIKSAIKKLEKKEKSNKRSWIICQFLTHAGFPFGLILTAIFAALNLPVKMDFPIIHFLLNINLF